MKPIFIQKSYIIATIMKIKSKYFNEKYVTFDEVSKIRECLADEFEKNKLQIHITDDVDTQFFDIYEGIYLLNKKNRIQLPEIENRFQSYISSETMTIIWDEESIYDKLIEIKKEKYEHLVAKEHIKLKQLIKKRS